MGRSRAASSNFKSKRVNELRKRKKVVENSYPSPKNKGRDITRRTEKEFLYQEGSNRNNHHRRCFFRIIKEYWEDPRDANGR